MSDRGGGRNEACEQPTGLDHGASRTALPAKGRLLPRKSKYVFRTQRASREAPGFGTHDRCAQTPGAPDDKRGFWRAFGFAARPTRLTQGGSSTIWPRRRPMHRIGCICRQGPSVRVAIGLMLPQPRPCDASRKATRHGAFVQFDAEAALHSVLETGRCGFRISRIHGKAMNFALAWSRVYYGLLPTIYHLPSNGLSIAAPISDCARIANPTSLLRTGLPGFGRVHARFLRS